MKWSLTISGNHAGGSEDENGAFKFELARRAAEFMESLDGATMGDVFFHPDEPSDHIDLLRQHPEVP